MRILVTIPHYFGARRAAARHGSLGDRAAERRLALEATIRALTENFGGPQAMIDGRERRAEPANRDSVHELDIVLCTTGDRHLLDRLDLPDAAFRRHATTAEAALLGFECHAVLRDGIGRYDWFCYLEDDIVVGDPALFAKLAWFGGWAGEDCLLQPNRFECDPVSPFRKLYIDGPLPRDWSAPYQDTSDRPTLSAPVLGRPIRFERPGNPHAGCFFLSAPQMAHWAGRRWFLDRDVRFVSPLESAATIGIMRSFRVYKPGRDNAAFVEVRHADNRYRVTPGESGVRIEPRSA